MSMLSITVNGKLANVDVEPATPLLGVIREPLQLTGTKFGCGIALMRHASFGGRRLAHPDH